MKGLLKNLQCSKNLQKIKDCNNEFCEFCQTKTDFSCVSCRGNLAILNNMCYCPHNQVINPVNFKCEGFLSKYTIFI